MPALIAALTGCAAALVGSSPCSLQAPPHPLPSQVPESSGVVASPSFPGVFWTHNDSGHEPVLFAVDREGTLLGTVWIEGAQNRDWEDLDVGPCETGYCLYIHDTGDNREERSDPAVYRVAEPSPDDQRSAAAERFPLRFPDGPRDVEATYLLPGERLFFVSKGRNHPVELYRAPPLDEPDFPLELERIQTLTTRSPWLPQHVTGGAATSDGSLVALRTYETLRFHRPGPDGRLEPTAGGIVNLRPLREAQGEAVGFVPGGGIVLTSERGPGGSLGSIAFLTCTDLDAQW